MFNKHFLYFKIIGFVIRIGFFSSGPIEKTTLPNDLRTKIKKLLCGLEVGERDGVDYSINLYPTQPFFYKKKDSNTTEAMEKGEWDIYFFREKKRSIDSFQHISIYQFESLLSYVLQTMMVNNGGFFLHGSAIQIGKMANVFTGESGDGKSTVARLLSKKFPILTDEYVAIRKQGGKYLFFQTHNREKIFIKKNISGREIKGIFFLSKTPYIKIDKYNKFKAGKKMISQLWFGPGEKNVQIHNLMSFLYGFDNFYMLSFYKSSKKLIQEFQKQDEKS